MYTVRRTYLDKKAQCHKKKTNQVYCTESISIKQTESGENQRSITIGFRQLYLNYQPKQSQAVLLSVSIRQLYLNYQPKQSKQGSQFTFPGCCADKEIKK